jgi:hypothetical protein
MRSIKTSIKEIADYWKVNNTISELELNFDWSDADTHCWNCGDDKKEKVGKKVKLERCHIVPHALGGKDEPANYVLLCHRCHYESPDSINPKYMWDWIKNNKTKTSLTNTYKIEKALNLFEIRKGYSLVEFLTKKNHSMETINSILCNEIKNINTHGYEYTVESIYVLFCELIDKISE